ncbi:MAG: hypothetical protein RLZZ535_2894 [Cyanobacteriota bacterium]|jgi:hypothetical protein
MAHVCCGPGYASPQAAMKAEPEKLLYAIAFSLKCDRLIRFLDKNAIAFPRLFNVGRATRDAKLVL